MKKIIIIILFLVASLSFTTVSASNVERQEYDRFIETASLLGIEVDVSFQDFKADYHDTNGMYPSIVEYTDALILELNYFSATEDLVVTRSSSSGGSLQWYENIIDSNGNEHISQRPNYDTCALESYANRGDLIFEDTTFDHIAIVEGWFYSTTYDMYYLRVIESTPDAKRFDYDHDDIGVIRSVYDCDRYNASSGNRLLHVKNLTNPTTIDNIIDYTISELGDRYQALFTIADACDDRDRWYCSQLAWCAYNEYGFDIAIHDGGMILPNEIRDDDDIISIKVPTYSSC